MKLRTPTRRSISRQLVIGLLLILIWWPVAWLQLQPLSDYYFFPLWFGFILTIDGLVRYRTGTSLLTRSRSKFALLFVASMPFWWVFEGLNQFLGNWQYHTPRSYTSLEYFLLASISFSTVVPAVLGMTELFASFRIGERLPRLPVLPLHRGRLLRLHLFGWIMLATVILFPRYAFPLTWLSVFFIIEPINVAVGQRSIGDFVRSGHWAPVWNVMLATMATGFFWEMWNFYSLPKWTYNVPWVDFGRIFEMPILGYFGYLPFGLEVFSVFALGFWIIFRQPQRYAIATANDDSNPMQSSAAPLGRV